MGLGYLLPALLEHIENWFVGETFQQQGDDDKANYLRKEQPWIPSEGLGGIAHRIHNATGGCEK
jgi:hypothetical protein